MNNQNLKKIAFETENIEPGRQMENYPKLPRQKKMCSLLKKYCNVHDRVIDVGCGKTYDQLRYLISLGFDDLSGVDFDLSPGDGKINLIQRDIEADLNLPASYDRVIMADVLEHVRFPRLLLKKVLKHTNNDGLIFLSIPNAGHFINGLLLSIFPRHLNMSSAFGPWGHYYFFTFYQLKRIFSLFDLDIVEWTGTDLEFRYLEMHWSKRVGMWILNFVPFLINFGILKKIFSDHLYFVLKKKNDHFADLPDEIIFEANV